VAPEIEAFIRKATDATEMVVLEEIQSLWSGYGKILRIALKGYEKKTLVLKHVRFPTIESHPRGWNTNISHERKVKSYQIEKYFYENYSDQCHDFVRVPKCIAVGMEGEDSFMLLEDLDDAGYPERRVSATKSDIKACIAWLAHFHVLFLNEEPKGLWKTGTYWHLETRPDELEQLSDQKLKNAAQVIDKTLKESPFQTWVHGDAKIANFCFSDKNKKVAAVDFQYVGGGCGMKDLAYFIGSCLDENECELQEKILLDFYFDQVREASKKLSRKIDVKALEENWRSLYPVAWADFHRFLKGWSPGHWKLNHYSERLSQEVIEALS